MAATNRSDTYFAALAQRRTSLRDNLIAELDCRHEIVWEVGSGHGHFLAAFAAAHPDRQCVGVDIVSERIGRALRKRDRAKLRNLHFFRADAKLFLETLPTNIAITDTFVLFPDPWPKVRHHKHRVLQPALLDLLALRTGAGSRLFFRTDFEPYFEAAAAVVRKHPQWRMVDEPWPFEFETVFQRRAAHFRSYVARRIIS